MWPQSFVSKIPQNEMSRVIEENKALRSQVNHLNSQVCTLREQNDNLQAENARLRALLPPPPPPPPSNRVYTAPNDNTLHLPVVLESLAVMRNHFQRQGTLRQCSQPGCNHYAFEQTCFRAGHVGWCRTHNRIVSGDWTSCSVKTEDRGDCVPIWWEQRDDWADIVNRAYREGKIGRKGLRPPDLHLLLFSPIHNLRQSLLEEVRMKRRQWSPDDSGGDFVWEASILSDHEGVVDSGIGPSLRLEDLLQ